MIIIIATFLFILWLCGVLGAYSVGWPYHMLLVASVMLVFWAAMRTRKPEITEIMINNQIPETEAEKVREIMNKNRLNEQEALELLNIRREPYFSDSNELLVTEAEKIKKIMNKNRLNRQEAAELLSFRLKLHQ